MEGLVEFLKELLKISPYAVLLVLAFVLFFHMHKNSVKELTSTYDKTISEIRGAYSESVNKVINLIEKK